MALDCFGETPSHSYPKWSIEQFDALLCRSTTPSWLIAKSLYFHKANLTQINNAMSNELKHGTNPTLDLAKQGLYNPDDTFTIFHPKNIKWIADATGIFMQPIDSQFISALLAKSPDPYQVEGFSIWSSTIGIYSIERSFLERAIKVLELNPNLLYM